MMKISVFYSLLSLSIALHANSVNATHSSTNQRIRGGIGVQEASRNLAPIELVEEVEEDRDSVITCFDYSEVLKIDSKGCSEWLLYRHLREIYKEQDQLEETPRCDGGFEMELKRLTNTVDTTGREWLGALKNLCVNAFVNSDALDSVDTVDWSKIEETGVDMSEYFEGGTFLNNFQQ